MPAFAEHFERYAKWVAGGNAGAMSYLERGLDRRRDPRVVLPSAKSILCVAVPYSPGLKGAAEPSQGPRYARYIHGRDYHLSIAERLEEVMLAVAAKTGKALEWKVCVDTSAVLERSWAALAGLGWVGKNTLLLHPKHGSYLLLGEVLISEEVGKGPTPMASLCGHCRRCLDACPTGAFTAPRELDSRKCISYWTLEKRGDLAIPPESKAKIGAWVAGCDVCQEVCPFNFKTTRDAAPDAPLQDDATSLSFWEGLLLETPEEYKQRVKPSSLSRVKPVQFSRNLAIALGNMAPSIEGSQKSRLLALARSRLESETDEVARTEWQACVASLEAGAGG